MRIAWATVLVFGTLFTACGMANAAGTTVPEPFQGHDDSSQYSIDYSDLSAILKVVVVDTGRSTRRVASEADDLTGTRVKAKIKKTANEANRFYYETFEDDEEAAAFLKNIQTSLEALPTEAPLEHFSRDEQLAYWLNLYNVTVLNEVIAVYPRNNLKKYVTGKNSIFSKKLLTVAGIPLSLDDIQYTILKQNYDNDPLIMYGLYKGIIGGPNIRKSAYTGSDVYRALKNNAIEFINSNRGTYIQSEKTFRVSSLYERNKTYFSDFESDLSAHLLNFLEGRERNALQAASKIKANIDDWSVTDLGGTHRRVGGSLADSRAALMDSVKSTVPADGGGFTAAAVGAGSSFMAAKGRQLSLARIDPSLLEVLQDIDEKRLSENQRKSSVNIEELESSPGDTDNESSDAPDNNQ
tara:strand:- start:14015 stop:15244 length:1230 start_codon:yes stop_codon:yes gene_type:complete